MAIQIRPDCKEAMPQKMAGQQESSPRQGGNGTAPPASGIAQQKAFRTAEHPGYVLVRARLRPLQRKLRWANVDGRETQAQPSRTGAQQQQPEAHRNKTR